MLKYPLIQPQMLAALAGAGHSSQVLITDGNYPAATSLGRNATLVSLNLTPGVLSSTDVLQALLAAIPVEKACTMDYARIGPYAMSEDPPVWLEYRDILTAAGYGDDLSLTPMDRQDFYEAAAGPDVALVVQTADQRIYANILLTISVVLPATTDA